MECTNVYGCKLRSGFMGETCTVCGEDNFGGRLCQSEQERLDRENRATQQQSEKSSQ